MSHLENEITRIFLELLEEQQPDVFADATFWETLELNVQLMLEEEQIDPVLKTSLWQFYSQKMEEWKDVTEPAKFSRDEIQTEPARLGSPRQPENLVDDRLFRSLLEKVQQKYPTLDFEVVFFERRCRRAFKLYDGDQISLHQLYATFLNKSDTDTLDFSNYPEPTLMPLFVRAVQSGRYQGWPKITEAWKDFVRLVKRVKAEFWKQKKEQDLMGDGSINGEAIQREVRRLLEIS